MKQIVQDYLFDEAIKYLGKYPATKKKIEEYLHKKIRNKKIYSKVSFPENVPNDIIIKNVVLRLEELKIINESHYLETLFHYYMGSLFSIKKIRNKLFQKGFDQKNINEFISIKLEEDPDFEFKILERYIKKKKFENFEKIELKKKLYQKGFSENSIYNAIKE